MDKLEFERRCMACAGRLHRIALAMLAREADGEDAVQEALVRAWIGLKTLREPQYFETWLCRILINECKRMLRQRKRQAMAELSDALPAPKPPNPALWEALRRLDVKERLPLTLHHAEGYTIAQCAHLLHLPQSTVKWRIHQGKQKLAKLLAQEVKA